METYLTIAELAEYIKLSAQTVRRYVLNKTVRLRQSRKMTVKANCVFCLRRKTRRGKLRRMTGTIPGESGIDIINIV